MSWREEQEAWEKAVADAKANPVEMSAAELVALLEKYMADVLHQEGTTFVESVEAGGYFDYTPTEAVLLQKLSDKM